MRHKIVLALIFFVILSVLLYVGIYLASPPYFTDFATTQDIKTHILSKLHLGTSLNAVQSAMSDRIFGYVECYDYADSNIDDHLFACTALKGNFWFYGLVFHFRNGALTDVDVSEVYRGL